MLQTFLQQFIPAMEEGLMLGVPLGILFVLIRRLQHEEYRRAFRSALKWGFWLSIFLVAVRVGTRNAVSRELLEGAATFITLAGEAVILFKLLKPDKDFSKPLKISLAAAVMTLFLYHGFELWLIPVGSVIAALGDYFTVEFLTKILGFVSGALFAFVSSFMIYKAADALNDTRLKFVFVIIFAACIIRQIIFLIQVLMARNFLSSEIWMDLMAPIINSSDLLIFVIFAAILVLPITLFSQPKPARLPEYNPAEYRKVLAQAIHKRRWGTGVIIALALMTTSSSAGSMIANRQAQIVPAVEVTANNGSVDVDLEIVKDGHLHRFVYRASGGEMVRYIVILKGGSAYGVGLDACEICGATGYYERDNQVICKLCDVQMNKATIGTRGGCNPIPISYSIEGGKLKVPQAELEKNARIFGGG
ncbi:MAG: DUF2318 domain-containing protein [Selenomonadaceae bacterium]|nr:DUF2318 domain-containing protein [Selenomonadaceae bacterium]